MSNDLVPADLAALPALINVTVNEAEMHARGAMSAALRAGALLRQAKELVPHGEFEQWISTNCELAVRTAQAYMRLSKHHADLPPAKAQRVAQLPVRDAVRAIATDPEAPTRHATVRLATRSDIDRAAKALRASADQLRRAARVIEIDGLKGAQLPGLRSKLVRALAAVDRLGDDGERHA